MSVESKTTFQLGSLYVNFKNVTKRNFVEGNVYIYDVDIAPSTKLGFY